MTQSTKQKEKYYFYNFEGFDEDNEEVEGSGIISTFNQNIERVYESL